MQEEGGLMTLTFCTEKEEEGEEEEEKTKQNTNHFPSHYDWAILLTGGEVCLRFCADLTAVLPGGSPHC